MIPTSEDLEQAFLADIVAHADDPSRWLILADWLEDQADPRAELVRLTWSLQAEAGRPDFKKRQARVQELLAGGMIPVRPRLSLDGFEFAWVPPGSFVMGSPPREAGRFPNEARHRVTLTRAYFVGVYPVTQWQWLEVMGTAPSYFSRRGGGADRVLDVADEDLAWFPVESVPFDAAQEFCARLAARLGRPVA